MERPSDFCRGYAVMQVKGAEPTLLLSRLAAKNTEFWGAVARDDFTLRFKVRLASIEEVKTAAKGCGCEAELICRRGLPIRAKAIKKRYVLLALPILLLLSLTASSFFVWSMEVEGNDKVTQTEILNALEQCGVHIGSFHPAFNNELIRSRVLLLIPELKWISVRVFGSSVNVQVRERTKIPEIFDEEQAVRLVAKRAGIIKNMRIKAGLPVMKENFVAAPGDILVESAVPGLLGDVQCVHASGSVRASTFYELSAILPVTYNQKEYTGEASQCYALVIGDKRINFYRSSRILDAECDNIISESKVGIKGLFELPISIIKIQSRPFELAEREYLPETAKTMLSAALEKALSDSIGKDGQVVEKNITCTASRGYYIATLRAECIQEIAVEQKLSAEEIHAAESARKEKTEE